MKKTPKISETIGESIVFFSLRQIVWKVAEISHIWGF